ncbi:helix-turn-helix domain-containing protein [Streptomyces sp. NPDC086549]|uniref:helix-turn-helix domain-containing protein n=1 Tax=Streptomyces sp. NPDC086549 TaxID=3365752 RepID=UPI00380B91DF
MTPARTRGPRRGRVPRAGRGRARGTRPFRPPCRRPAARSRRDPRRRLVRTGLTYFACDGSLARTAAALSIRVDTLCRRLDRMPALLGPQWRHGDRVHLAPKAHVACA